MARKRHLSELGMLLTSKLPLAVCQTKGYKAYYAGSIPAALCNCKEPAYSDIMAGRVAPDGKVYSSKLFDTKEEAISFARSLGFDPQ